MAVFDLRTFIQERARVFDSNLDLAAGSPFDTQVVQPILRRLGQDPFSVDMAVFMHDRIKQAFPELAINEGDALTDLLIKPAVLLWDPIVREIFRVRNNLSFRDPTILTTDESEALGANLFSEREKGNFAKGSARTFFAQPRSVSFSPTNFFTSRGGQHFFPDGLQTITLEEMLLNVDGDLYYFDVNVLAERAGVEFNIGPNELITVANIESAVKVTNLRRFRGGESEETTVDFIDRTRQELTERSMVTLRGIGARVTQSFPEVSRLGVVGFNDPEMQRDVIKGGGLGPIIASSMLGETISDGENKARTHRFRDTSVDFISLIGATTVPPSGFVITILGAFDAGITSRDLNVTRVLNSTDIDVDEQIFVQGRTALNWVLRTRSLTLSDIPGGILFPDSALGTVTIPDDEIHIGGSYDVHLRGVSFDEASVVIENLTDDEPAAAGNLLSMVTANTVSLGDYILDVNYTDADPVFQAFEDAKVFGFTLQILDGVNAGNYRVLDVVQTPLASPAIVIDQSLAFPLLGNFRWRLVDTLEIDLIEPKETRVSGNDLATVQNTDQVTSSGGTDFVSLGVSVDDTLRIDDGPDAGDYSVKSLPAFNIIQIDRPATASNSNLGYTVFRANTAGGALRPLVRVTALNLLDTSGQPVGSKIPYAKPIDIQSRAFQNPGRGVKVSVRDGRLGIVSLPEPGGGFLLTGLTLIITFLDNSPPIPSVTTTFSGVLSAAAAVAEINAAAVGVLGPGTVLAAVLPGDRIGIVPIGNFSITNGASTALTVLFGDAQFRTTADIRSDTVDAAGGWVAVTPAINEDNLDVAAVLDGNQIGFYGNLTTALGVGYTGLLSANLFGADLQESNFAPEVGRQIQVGSRSIGSARCFFLEPTSIEFNEDSFFEATLEDGVVVRFFPDPTLDTTRIPPPPTTVMPKDGQSTGANVMFTSASQDFILSGIRTGDELIIKYVPIIGTVALADPVVGMHLATLVLSVDGRADQTITFVNDVPAFPADVSRSGVAEQINNTVGMDIATIGVGNFLELEGDVSIVVRTTGTANALLGLAPGPLDQNNDSEHAGSYSVVLVSTTILQVQLPFPGIAALTRESFQVVRPGAQRISSTAMDVNKAEAGLYYFDVELVSEGTGDLWNIASDIQLKVENFRSDGYYLTTEDENLTFSGVEHPKLHVSRSILEVGVSDDPQNATIISGQNLEVVYERSILTSDVQNFASSETERVVCASPLSRHLIPHFVRFDFQYVGGSREDVVTRDIENYINALFPSDLLEASDLQDIAYRRGADSVRTPIDLIAVVHDRDRTIQAQRSKSNLSTGRLASFHPDVITITRSVG